MKKIMAICMCCGVLALSAADRTTPADIRARLEKMPKTHRILTDMKWTPESVLANPYGKLIAENILAESDRLLKTEPLPRVMIGRRLLQQVRLIQGRIFNLALAAKLTGQRVYADRAIAEMRSAAKFTDWNPSHFLDPCEMSMGMAAGYDWLEEYLTPEDRDLIRTALVEKALKPARARKMFWQKGSNNWTQLCHAGLTAAALVTWELDPELAAVTIADAVNAQEKVMRHSYSPDGAFPEGPGYWALGTMYEVYLIAMMEHAFGTDFGLSQIPGWSRTGDFRMSAVGNTGLNYNYGDSGVDDKRSLPFFYLAKKFNRPDYIPAVAVSAFAGKPYSWQFPAQCILWLPEKAEKKDPPLCYWSCEASTPVAMMRTAWERDAQFFAIKGGSPYVSHGHMDCGSFIYEVFGIRWILEPVCEDYTNLEKVLPDRMWYGNQSSPRWTVFRLGPECHSIPRIGSNFPWVKGFAKMSVTPCKDGFPEVKLDLSSLYPEAKSLIRIAKLDKNGLTITDRVTGLKPGMEFRFLFLTDATVEKGKDDILRLTKDHHTVLVSAQPVTFCTSIAPEWFWQNAKVFLKPYETPFDPEATRVSFTIRTDDNGEAAYIIRLTPVKKAD